MLWMRFNSFMLVLVFLALVGVIAMLASDAYGGPLDPPGPVASTDGVREPGTPISSIPFTISQPGRYYLTRNLTGVGGQSGVTIASNGVTLDLNGFTLQGVPSAANGVLVSGARNGVRIENGTVRGWFNGIDATNAALSSISGVSVIGNGIASNDGSFGILLGAYSSIDNCHVSGNTATGIYADSITIRDCVITQNGNDGVRAVGHTFLQGNHIQANFLSGGGVGGAWRDVRVVGLNNVLVDNVVSFIYVDTTAQGSTHIFARNAYCSITKLGAGSTANAQEFENLQSIC